MPTVLQADCQNCFGLCCVAPAFATSADFAIDKPAGHPCPNLQSDFSCGIHSHLRQQRFSGCAVFDCLGAGQKVAQVTFAGVDWRAAPETAQHMFDAFGVMRQLHELLRYLTEALNLPGTGPLHDELDLAYTATERLTFGTAEDLLAIDVAAHREEVNELLLRASEVARAGLPGLHSDRRRADLTGADLSRADLRAANLRGALLIAADLSGADLSGADVTGADFRAADIGGADFSCAIFLTQSQLDATQGDAQTKLPPSLNHPAHWAPAGPDVS